MSDAAGATTATSTVDHDGALAFAVRTSCLLFVCGLVLGCQAKVKEATRRTPASEAKAPSTTPPHGVPVEVPGGLNAGRSYYQSRGIVTLDVKQSAIKLGDQFSLVNQTTKATLIDYDNSALAFSLDEPVAFSLTEAYDITLRLYLLDPAIGGGFAPGDNELRLLVAGDEGGRSARAIVTLTDFPLFAVTTTAFDTGEQRVGGFQGGFEPFGNAVVTSNGKSFIATGILNISNQ